MTLTPLPYRVVDRRDETHDTVTLVLEPAGEALGSFAPGQFAMLYAFGVGEVPVSVSRIPGERRITHTVRAVGAVTRALCGLRTGAWLGVRGPFGTCWDLAAARGRDLLVVAGGIGIAPLRPLIDAVLAEPHAYGRLNVLAGARTPGDALYRDEFPAWERPFAAVTVDRPSDDWTGRVGVVTTLLGEARFTPAGTTAFVCGPEVMIRATARALVHRGVRPDRIRVSLERNMRCATGHCGHCQLGPLLLCRDGPVVGYDRAEPLLTVREL
ncbi:FAD/NAD(P)-binding protein [Streptomyces tirandamycinicus]|uniref:Oxidoreductase n=1 Tax=Streptomyces tirandamycinicus TaxID=2174846 RepID=A0A2S1SM75_9ACTN|nr:FAD/NAD(P)-binding protein [Streptomyces tirandamycinicus]AWI27456.1 oxidoreductase [Streptomyces tirandamycinicus]